MKVKNMFLSGVVVAAVVGLSGCSAIPLEPAAQSVMITHEAAPASCKFKGTVTANQGNAFTGAFTSNKNMQTGAFNDLRNQALAMGGNRVVLIMSIAAVTASGGSDGWGGSSYSSQQTNVALTGSVYNCPNQ